MSRRTAEPQPKETKSWGQNHGGKGTALGGVPYLLKRHAFHSCSQQLHRSLRTRPEPKARKWGAGRFGKGEVRQGRGEPVNAPERHRSPQRGERHRGAERRSRNQRRQNHGDKIMGGEAEQWAGFHISIVVANNFIPACEQSWLAEPPPKNLKPRNTRNTRKGGKGERLKR